MPSVLVSTKDMSKAEWLQWRAKGIGGSDASIVCGLNRYKSPVELWMEKTGQIEPKIAGEAAHWGTMLEPIIRNEFTERTGLQIKQEHAILQHSEYPFMLANLDGIVSGPMAVYVCNYHFSLFKIYHRFLTYLLASTVLAAMIAGRL